MSKFFKSYLGSRRGFTLIDLLVAMGIGSITTVTIIAVVGQAAKVRRIETVYSGAMLVRQQVFENLNRFDNFQATIHHASNAGRFACLKTHTCGYDANGTGNFNLQIANGGTYAGGFTAHPIPFYNASNPNEGFTPDGIRCVSTSATPNRQCPIRVNLSWQNKCAPNCNPGMIRIRVDIRIFLSDPRIAGLRGRRVDLTNYGFELIKNVYDLNLTKPYP